MAITMENILSLKHWLRYQKAKRLFWDPSQIDLTQDKYQWSALTLPERKAAVRTCHFFLAGESVVASDLAPLLIALRTDPARNAECAYLVTQIMDEVLHVEFFTRWIQEVAGERATGQCISARHSQFFTRTLPTALDRLLTDPSDDAVIRAISTYHFITESVIAEAGYAGFAASFAERKLFPGLLDGIRLVRRDEARHIAFGIDMIRELARRSPALLAAFRDVTSTNAPIAIGMFRDYFDPFGATSPFGLIRSQTVSYAIAHYSKRLADVTEYAPSASAPVQAPAIPIMA